MRENIVDLYTELFPTQGPFELEAHLKTFDPAVQATPAREWFAVIATGGSKEAIEAELSAVRAVVEAYLCFDEASEAVSILVFLSEAVDASRLSAYAAGFGRWLSGRVGASLFCSGCPCNRLVLPYAGSLAEGHLNGFGRNPLLSLDAEYLPLSEAIVRVRRTPVEALNKLLQPYLSGLEGSIPAELKGYPQWVVWRYEERNSKQCKVPYDPKSGRRASVNNPATWGSFAEALARAGAGYDGIGFVLTEDDPYTVIDLDGKDGQGLSMLEIHTIADRFGSYTELSPSGKGVHIWLKGTSPLSGRRRGPVEVYSSKRFLTVTSQPLEGFNLGIAEGLDELQRFCDEVLAGLRTHAHESDGGRSGDKLPPLPTTCAIKEGPKNVPMTLPIDGWSVPPQALEAKNGHRFTELLRSGNWMGLGYPSQSEADLALCRWLYFWLGEPEKVDLAFRNSALYRDKWDERHAADGRTYGELTLGACSNGPVYTGRVNPDRFTGPVAEFEEILRRPGAWSGRSGNSQWAVYKALVHLAGLSHRPAGVEAWEHPQGVEVAVPLERLALTTGLSRDTAKTALRRLQERGLVQPGRPHDRRVPKSYVLVRQQKDIGDVSLPLRNTQVVGRGGSLSPKLLEARWGAGRLGKSAWQVIVALQALDSVATGAAIARQLGKDPRSLRRILRRLLHFRVVLRKPDKSYVLPEDWEARLHKALEADGSRRQHANAEAAYAEKCRRRREELEGWEKQKTQDAEPAYKGTASPRLSLPRPRPREQHVLGDAV
ncbi:phage NrS-1 polymerase family protein [Meiothermus taiwanensis]|uniref:phage NrS-1 polymerase family protein n=1 Tax=Meiothermus taiwanensis TaxID=172827 RepID=UPI0007B48D40|nr:hypothetical protein [Meiothermus taiwanensis]KZK14832.1 hypothetical protein A3962_12420 [Meiothermus taiwanensis]